MKVSEKLVYIGKFSEAIFWLEEEVLKVCL